MALDALVDAFGGNDFARIDLEPFLDLRETRPVIRAVDGEIVELRWPETTVTEVFAPDADQDFVVVTGPEPALNWRSYCTALLDLAEALGCSTVVTLGAFLADVPHTIDVPLGGSAADQEIADRLELIPSNYEGPGGVTAVVNYECRRRGIDYLSIWAAVPHYIAAMPNPKAALALVRKLEVLTGAAIDLGDLEADAIEQARQVEQAVEHDSDLRGFVEQLEEAAEEDSDGEVPEEEIPSGDSIEREVQRFLRERDPDSSQD